MYIEIKMEKKRKQRNNIISTLYLLSFLFISVIFSSQVQARSDILECRETYKGDTHNSKELPQNYSHTYKLRWGKTFPELFKKYQFACRSNTSIKPINQHYVVINQQLYWLKSGTDSYSECTSLIPCQGAGPHRTRIILTHRYSLLPKQQTIKQFTPISEEFPYATDGESFYYQNKVIPNVVIPESTADSSLQILDRLGYYVIFASNVIYEGQTIQGADAKTFEILHNDFTYDDFSRDKNHIYWQGQVLQGADPQSFEIINRSLAQDESRVWRIHIGDKLPTLEPLFQPNIKKLQGAYTKNSTQVFISDSLIKDADASSFEVVDLVCKKPDSDCGIKKDLLCPVANAPTLRCGVDQYANSAADYEFGWAKDKNHVYQGGFPYKGMDAKTFKLILLSFSRSYYAIDKDNLYNLDWPSRYTFATTGTVYGPIYRNDDHTYQPIFADEQGFFTVEKERTNMCMDEVDPSKKVRGARGKLQAMQASDGIAWAFEDDDFQYFFKNTATYYTAAKSDKEHFDKMDYIIEKKTNTKYPMFWAGTTCKPIANN